MNRKQKPKQNIKAKLDEVSNQFKMQVYTQALQSATLKPWHSGVKLGAFYDVDEIAYDLMSLRGRSKLFYLNDPVYRPIVNNLVQNVVGSGFVYRDSENPANEDRFYQWTKDCDETGLSFNDMCETAIRWFFVYGDCLLVKRDNKVILIDPERIGLVNTHYKENKVVDGVEIDSLSLKPIAFHISTVDGGSVRIVAEDCIYLSNKLIPAQVRGEPLLSQIADLLEYLYQYTNSVVLSAQISASLSLIVKTPDVEGFDSYVGSRLDLKTPTLTYMPENASIEQIKSEQPMQNYDSFQANLLNQICTAVGITPAALGNVEKLNFSASKLSIEVARDTYRRWQRYFIDYLLTPLWKWQIGTDSVEFRGAGFKSYDRQNDYSAESLAIETGLETMADLLADRGIWFDEHIEKLKKEEIALDGIKLNHSQMTQKDDNA